MNKDLLKTSLLALFVAVIALVAFFELKEFKEEEDVKDIKDKVVKLYSSEVTSIKMMPENISLVKTNDLWKIITPFEDVTQSSQIEEWLVSLLVKEGRALGSSLDDDLIWEDFGFFGKEKEISFRDIQGKQVFVGVSEKEAFDGSAYLRVKDKSLETLFSSDNDWKKELAKKSYDFRSKNVFNWGEVAKDSKVLKLNISNKKEKEYYELNFSDDKWSAKRRKKWGIDATLLEEYFSKVKSYKVLAFVDKGAYKGKSELTVKINLSSGEKLTLDILKDKSTVYAKVSYRPDILIKLDRKVVKELYTPLLSLKDKKDLYFYDQNKVKSFLIKTGSKAYRVKSEKGVWVLKNKSEAPKNKEFNGAKVFDLFSALDSIGGVRYVKSDTRFYTSQRRLTFYDSKNNMYYQLEVGQKFPTKFGSRRTDGYLLRSSSSSELLVVEAKKINELFKIDFFQKKVIEEQNKEAGLNSKDEVKK